MKKISLFIFVWLLISSICAQEKMAVTFTGQSIGGVHQQLDSVRIKNLSRQWSETIIFPDTVLSLTQTIGIVEYQTNNIELDQNIPNPFSGCTNFKISLTEPEHVYFSVFEMSGKRILTYDQFMLAGTHFFELNLQNVQSYLLSVHSSTMSKSIKMINTGHGSGNSLIYKGLANNRMLKKISSKDFKKGDTLQYIGYTTYNGIQYSSLPKTETLSDSKTAILSFNFKYCSLLYSDTNAVCCNNFLWYDSLLTKSGNYQKIFKTAEDCDSIVTLHLRVNQKITVGGVDFVMVDVQGGTFTMGDATNDLALPLHEVTLSNYYIGETEVTQELWHAVMGNNPSISKGVNKPVESVNWVNCCQFLTKLSQMTGKFFRLPTEAEWNFAAMGGNESKHFKYSGDSILDNVAWHIDNSDTLSHPVKLKACNELGLYDMTGNLYEWCYDWLDYFTATSLTNPIGTCYSPWGMRVVCGGSFSNTHAEYKVRERGYFGQYGKSGDIGLRLVLDTSSYIMDDRDGNIYKTCQIGDQIWMAENLKYLPKVDTAAAGSEDAGYEDSLFYYVIGWNTNSVDVVKSSGEYYEYGVLYNWNSAISACPNGWHLPTEAEWLKLGNFLGGGTLVGGKMKTTKFNSPNTGATNESGFSGYAGGFRDINGSFYNLGFNGIWWTATKNNLLPLILFLAYNNTALLYENQYSESYGFSVRCVKD